MKIFIFFILFSFSQHILSQNLVELLLSENVSIKIPDGYYVRDTLGTKTVVKDLSIKSMVSISKIREEKKIIILNKKELIKGYSSFQDGVLARNNGNLIKKKIFKHKGMKLSIMYFNNTVLNKNVNYCNIALYLKNHFYCVMFFSVEGDNIEEYESLKKKIISSIKFNEDLTFKNQFTE